MAQNHVNFVVISKSITIFIRWNGRQIVVSFNISTAIKLKGVYWILNGYVWIFSSLFILYNFILSMHLKMLQTLIINLWVGDRKPIIDLIWNTG